MTAAALIGLIVAILCLITVVLVAVLCFRNADKAYLTLNSMHIRQQKQLDSVLDRLMTIRWEDYVATTMMEPTEEGGFFPPTADGDDESDEEAGSWNALRSLRRPGKVEHHTPEEQALLDEDFPDEEDSQL